MLRNLAVLFVIPLLFIAIFGSIAFAEEPSFPFLFEWGSHGVLPGEVDRVRGISMDESGDVYVADTYNHRIQKFSGAGEFINLWGSNGLGDGQFQYPWGVVVDSSNTVFVLDAYNNRIQVFNSSGTFLRKWGSAGSGDGQFNLPRGIAIDDSGNIYVADTGNHRIQKFNNSGVFLNKWGTVGVRSGQFRAPRGIALDDLGNVYVADTSNHRIQKFDNTGMFLFRLGSRGSGDGQFISPWGITVDDSRMVYVADTGNHRVQRFSDSGEFLTKWGSLGSGAGQFSYPYGNTHSVKGKIYVADDAHRIQVFGLNEAPGLINPGDQTSRDNDVVSFQIIATDPEGSPITYSAVGLPDGLLIDAGSGMISGVIVNSVAGDYPVFITVSDGKLTDSAVFTWTIINEPPILINPGDQISRENEAISFPVIANDPEGSHIIYTAAGLPDGLSIDVDSGVISGILSSGTAGDHIIIITASDGTLTDSSVFSWTVLSGWPPSIESLTADPPNLDSRNHRPVPVNISVTVNDPDGADDIVLTTYSIIDEYGQYDVDEIELPENEIIYLIADRHGTDEDGRIYTLTVTVYDAGGESDMSTIDITVLHDHGKKDLK
ncbi:putative Ig domain-containing protein [Chloroflexota bacterium]